MSTEIGKIEDMAETKDISLNSFWAGTKKGESLQLTLHTNADWPDNTYMCMDKEGVKKLIQLLKDWVEE